MHTRYCPHCGSENIHRVKEKVQHFHIDAGIYHTYEHYHECEICNETWAHYVKEGKYKEQNGSA